MYNTRRQKEIGEIIREFDRVGNWFMLLVVVVVVRTFASTVGQLFVVDVVVVVIVVVIVVVSCCPNKPTIDHKIALEIALRSGNNGLDVAFKSG